MKALAAIAVFTLAPTSMFAATVISGPTLNLANGHTYYLLSQSYWSEAEAAAILLGGHLATIDDASENQFVLETFGSTAIANAPPGGIVSLWIGLSDAANEGTFVWSDGSPLGYTHFAPGEPAGGFPDEDYIGMLVTPTSWQPGLWHDIVFDGRLNDRVFGVVEIRPKCDCDFDGNNIVTDSDFEVFVNSYNILLCDDPEMPLGCPCDLNADGFVDDTDFQIFGRAYDALLCP